MQTSEPLPVSKPSPPRGVTWEKVYDCGCRCAGGPTLPDYCPEHGTPEAVEMAKEERQ